MSLPGAVHPLDLPTREVGGVLFRVCPLQVAIDALCATALQQSGALAVHFANAYSIALAADDPHYLAVLADPAAATFSDGVPVTWVGRRAYPEVARQWTRVYGPDVMAGVFDRCQRSGLSIRHYLVGGSPETLSALRREIGRRWPAVELVGAESPPFRPPSQQERLELQGRIRQTGADMVWVGLGTPKQDFAAHDLAPRVGATVLAVGAAFDFIAGTTKQAPVWMQRSGTEWLYRLSQEPRRLARRYLWGNPRFLVAAARQPGLRRTRAVGGSSAEPPSPGSD